MTLDESVDRGTCDSQYRSYLLRLWQETPGGEPRALLQDVVSGESQRFSNLEALFKHLDTSREHVE